MKYTIQQFRNDYPDDDACLDKIFALRYGDKPECPGCHRRSKFHRVKSRKSYACQWCAHQIYPCAGTPLQKTTTPLTSWFYAMYLMTATRNGVSAKELERQLGVSYKTAWRMGHKIRELMDALGISQPLDGHIEADETYVGGKRRGKRGRGAEGKSIVFGTLERGGNVKGWVVSDVKRRTLEPIIRTEVKEGATVSTDELRTYKDLARFGYEHGKVQHGEGEYVSGIHHVNGLEGFWSQLKRGIIGTHIHVSHKHLPKYVGEFAFRYNNRKNPSQMFERVIRNF